MKFGQLVDLRFPGLRGSVSATPGKRVQFGQGKSDTDDVGGSIVFPMPVGGRNKRIVGQSFDTRVGSVVALGVVFQTDDILAAPALLKVVSASHPSDPVSLISPLRGRRPR